MEPFKIAGKPQKGKIIYTYGQYTDTLLPSQSTCTSTATLRECFAQAPTIYKPKKKVGIA